MPQNFLVSVGQSLCEVLERNEAVSLLSEVQSATPFDSWAWLSSLDAATPLEDKLLVVVRNSEENLLGWLPLKFSTERIFGFEVTVLRHLGHPLTDRHGIITSLPTDVFLSAVVEKIFHKGIRPAGIILDEVSNLNREIVVPNNWLLQQKRTTPALNTGPLKVTSAIRSFSKRANRAIKKIRKENYELAYWRPAYDEVPKLLFELKAIENNSWKGQSEAGLFSNGTKSKFIENVSAAVTKEQGLLVGTLKLNGQLISYRYGLLWRSVYYDFNFAYLPEFSKFSPGRVLLHNLIKRASEFGIQSIDASRTGSGYVNLLSDIADSSIKHNRIMFFKQGFIGFSLRQKYARAKPLWERLRASEHSAGARN